MYVVCSMYVVFCKIDHCIHIHWCIAMGLGHNDPWIESHMWPQQTWGQRSSRGQWSLVQVFGKRVSVSTYFDVFPNLILQWLQKYVITKAGETRGSRTALFSLQASLHPGLSLSRLVPVSSNRHSVKLTGTHRNFRPCQLALEWQIHLSIPQNSYKMPLLQLNSVLWIKFL